MKDAQNKSVASTGNSFFMPKSNVTVSAVFEQGVHGTTEFAWDYIGPEGYVTDATIYDGVTTVNLQTSRSYNIIKNYDKLLIDNDEYQVSIPYSGGTGAFVQNGTLFNNNGEAGYYDITMTDAGNGKWSVSILKTVGQMDVVPDQTYTGSAITPEPLVLAGSLSLNKGTDYEYSYTDNTNVGTAKVTVTFKGDYASLGSVEKEFTISQKPVTVTAKAQTVTVGGSIAEGTDQAELTGAVDGHTLTAITLSGDTSAVTDAGDIIPSAAKIEDGNGNDVTDNYDVTYVNGVLTVNPRQFTVAFDSNGGSEVDAQTVTEGDKATMPDPAPTQDGYRFIGWYQVTGEDTLADTPFDFDTVITEDVNLKAQWASPVTLTASMVDTNGAAVAGSITFPDGNGTTLFPGDEVTLTAPRVSGYNFTGWFAEDGAENLCRDLGYTFTVGDVTAFVARYEALPSVCLTIDGGSSYTVNGSQKSVEIVQYFPIGTEIALVSNAENFDYWSNSYGSVLSRSGTYTFRVSAAETIKAVFKPAMIENQATVVFESFYNQVMGKSQLSLGESIVLPPLPNRNGYTTIGWDMNGDGAYDASADKLDTAIQRGLDSDAKMVTIYAVYQVKPVEYTITVNGGSGSGTYQQQAVVIAEADTPAAGKKFSHWIDQNNEVRSYNPQYGFFADGNITLTAVYMDAQETVEAKGTTSIVDMYKDTANHKLSFVSMSSVPEGCTILKAGIICTDDESVAKSSAFDDQTAKYVRGDAHAGREYQYTWTKGTANCGNTLYVKAYLVYTDKNGNTHTVYGAEVVSQDFE